MASKEKPDAVPVTNDPEAIKKAVDKGTPITIPPTTQPIHNTPLTLPEQPEAQPVPSVGTLDFALHNAWEEVGHLLFDDKETDEVTGEQDRQFIREYLDGESPATNPTSGSLGRR